MSIIQSHTTSSLSENWRTINIDALDSESSQNFDLSSLYPAVADVSEAEVKSTAQQVRQLLRGGDMEGALRGACESAPWGASAEAVKELHLATVVEVLQSIKASDMTPMLKSIFSTQGGSEILDILMKYLYKGMASTTSSTPSTRNTTGRAVNNLTPQATGFSQMGGRATNGPENMGAQMSVLLSWHEKVVEVAGLGCVNRCMSDRRRV